MRKRRVYNLWALVRFALEEDRVEKRELPAFGMGENGWQG
jgi:hypothetical protein